MFLHGIPYVYLARHFPVLSPDRQYRKAPAQRDDARHLSKRIGFEPIHFLRSSRGYPLRICVTECFRYGDTVLAFAGIGYPRVQLSRNEWGVARLDVRGVAWVVTRRPEAGWWFREKLPGVPVLYTGT
ncbi:hypothetical protein [Paludifilum halophilum]|uniref:Uncharacterized protein n=1 Tax=Paludifilum halophilum TaxID=1642702 RepID=A0A235B7V5_9BACL|nr:hypothetical protein [Paludifilum halophilum]OYD08312.1 hypothetical protein CHM34_05545 [Paludifilum halophilum]